MRLSILLLIISAFLGHAQAQTNRSTIEKERAKIQGEIAGVQQLLAETKKNRKETTTHLTLLQKKLQLREQAIQNTNKQLGVINKQVIESGKEIVSLQTELDTLKREYERAVTYADKNRSSYDLLNFIFSANSFNDALIRISYLKSYHDDREKQKTEILKRQQLLSQQFYELKMHKQEKNAVLQTESDERAQLIAEKKEKDAVAMKLKSREASLNKELLAKQRLALKLRNAILKEVKKVGSHAKVESAKTTKNGTTATNNKNENTRKNVPPPFKNDTDESLSLNFEKNRRKLPWPVDGGTVTMEFGLQHPFGNPTIWQDNPGITIATKVGVPVKAVFDGEISAIFDVDDRLAIIIRHGKFLSTYSGLQTSQVTIGKKVKMGDILGVVGEKANNLGELDFIITNDKNTNQNPRLWLR